jgi:hypothetical protein
MGGTDGIPCFRPAGRDEKFFWSGFDEIFAVNVREMREKCQASFNKA